MSKRVVLDLTDDGDGVVPAPPAKESRVEWRDAMQPVSHGPARVSSRRSTLAAMGDEGASVIEYNQPESVLARMREDAMRAERYRDYAQQSFAAEMHRAQRPASVRRAANPEVARRNAEAARRELAMIERAKGNRTSPEPKDDPPPLERTPQPMAPVPAVVAAAPVRVAVAAAPVRVVAAAPAAPVHVAVEAAVPVPAPEPTPVRTILAPEYVKNQSGSDTDGTIDDEVARRPPRTSREAMFEVLNREQDAIYAMNLRRWRQGLKERDKLRALHETKKDFMN